MSKKIAVSLKNFSVKINGEYLLKDINYDFEANKIHYIAGPSGCGKTLLISHFNGLMTSQEGSIEILGEKINVKKNGKIKKIKDLRKKICLVFQFAEYQLFKKTILKDIIFGPSNFGISKKEATERAKKYINLVGLNETFLNRDPFGLSGGQKRRVAIAGVLAIEPDILVFDEPTGGLDPEGEKEILRIFLKLKELGKTIIVVTHSMNLALEIADNIVVMNNKTIVKAGEPYTIFSDKQLTDETKLFIPHVYKFIEELVQTNKKYEKIFDMKPRNYEQLAQCIVKLKGGKKKK